MNVTTMLAAAQGGKLYDNVAQSLDIGEAETRRAMEKLCPAIARQLKDAAEEDDDLFETLVDLIQDGEGTSPLDEPEALTDAEAISDGNAVLDDVYGSRNEAMVALRKVAPDVPERELAKLAPISAFAVVAALAQANQPMLAAQAQPAASMDSGLGGGGVIGTIIGSVIAGAVTGLIREVTSSRNWRGTTSYTKTKTRRPSSSRTKTKKKTGTRTKTQTRRTTPAGKSISVEDIFRDILGNLGK